MNPLARGLLLPLSLGLLACTAKGPTPQPTPDDPLEVAEGMEPVPPLPITEGPAVELERRPLRGGGDGARAGCSGEVFALPQSTRIVEPFGDQLLVVDDELGLHRVDPASGRQWTLGAPTPRALVGGGDAPVLCAPDGEVLRLDLPAQTEAATATLIGHSERCQVVANGPQVGLIGRRVPGHARVQALTPLAARMPEPDPMAPALDATIEPPSRDALVVTSAMMITSQGSDLTLEGAESSDQPRALAQGQPDLRSPLVHAGSLYWIAEGRVRRTTIAGGRIETLASQQADAQSLRVHAGVLHWIDDRGLARMALDVPEAKREVEHLPTSAVAPGWAWQGAALRFASRDDPSLWILHGRDPGESRTQLVRLDLDTCPASAWRPGPAHRPARPPSEPSPFYLGRVDAESELDLSHDGVFTVADLSPSERRLLSDLPAGAPVTQAHPGVPARVRVGSRFVFVGAGRPIDAEVVGIGSNGEAVSAFVKLSCDTPAQGHAGAASAVERCLGLRAAEILAFRPDEAPTQPTILRRAPSMSPERGEDKPEDALHRRARTSLEGRIRRAAAKLDLRPSRDGWMLDDIQTHRIFSVPEHGVAQLVVFAEQVFEDRRQPDQVTYFRAVAALDASGAFVEWIDPPQPRAAPFGWEPVPHERFDLTTVDLDGDGVHALVLDYAAWYGDYGGSAEAKILYQRTPEGWRRSLLDQPEAP